MPEQPKLTVPLLEFIKDAVKAERELREGDVKRLDGAIASQKALADQISTSSKEAAAASLVAQKEYNQTHNDLIKKIDGLTKTFAPSTDLDNLRRELDGRIQKQDSEIKELREARREVAGREGGVTTAKSEQARDLRFLLGIGLFLIALLQLLLHFIPTGVK